MEDDARIDDLLLADPSIRRAVEGELHLAAAIDHDACTSFAQFDAGLDLDLPADHPYALTELVRWGEMLDARRLLFACSPDGQPVGFAAFGFVDGQPFLDQLSVRRASMRRGIGGRLLALVQSWSAQQGELWLTTYRHVPWNRPWYERLGFNCHAEPACGPELRALLASERGGLPRPEERVAMVYRHPRA